MTKRKTCFIFNKIVLCKLLFICLSLFLSPLQTESQINSEKGLPFITNYQAKEYQAHPQNWAIAEDDNGIMYFGNSVCLLEYDGVKWRRVHDANNSGNAALVRSLTKDKNGRIYYGSYSDFGYLAPDSMGLNQERSLLKFIPEAFRNFNDTRTISATNEGIYFQSHEKLFRLRQKSIAPNESWEVKVWESPNKYMYAFYLDGTYYVHQQGVGLLKMVGDSLTLVPGSEFIGKQRMQVMLPYTSHSDTAKNSTTKKYLVGLFYTGLYIFDGKTFTPFKTEADSIFKSATLYKGTQLNDGSYALSTTGNGLVEMDAKGKIIQLINRGVGLQDESVLAVYTARNGSLWLGLDNGISRVETSSPFTQFTSQSGITTSGLSATRFEGAMYLGTSNGLMKFNSSNSKFEAVNDIHTNQIFNLIKDNDELLVPADGLYFIKDKKTHLIKASSSGDLSVQSLYILKKTPGVLIAGLAGGLAIFTKHSSDKKTDGSVTANEWLYVGKIATITDDIWSIVEQSDGKVWLGTGNGGVLRLSNITDQQEAVVLKNIKIERFGTERGLSKGNIHIFSIPGKELFVSNKSVFHYNEQQDKFITDSIFGAIGFGNDPNEYNMTIDQRGRIWINFGKETALAIPQPDGKYKIEKTQFLPFADRVTYRIFPEENGIVWFATNEGLIRFDEKLKKNYDQGFKTILRKIIAGESTLNTSQGSLTQKKVTLSFNNNTIRFEYAAPWFEKENKTQYQTWLQGFEKDRSNWDNNYYKEYTNLPVGKYTFHVRALNIYQKQSDETVYSFEILPPWYRTWWAYLFYALIAVAVIYSLIRWRTRQLHQKHRELEKTVSERTKELSHRVEELAVINSVQEGLVREIDMQGIYELVGEKLREIFNAQVIDIVTYDSKTNMLEDRYAYEKGDRSLLEPREPEGFRKHLVETRQLVLINQDFEKASLQYNNKILIGDHPKSAVLVPMISAGEVVGMISLQDLDKEHAFTEADVSLLTTLANSMSVALESARRFDETNRLLKETEQRTAELAVINSVQEGLAKELDMQAIYKLVGNKIQKVFNAQAVLICTFDYENGLEYFNYHIEKGEISSPEPRKYDKLRKHLIETREKIYISDHNETTAAQFDMKVVPGTELPKSLLFVPLITGDKVKSYVSLQNIDQANAFSEADIRLLETLANSMSVALENARLFDETTRLLKETEQRTAELAVINSVQDGLAKELDMEGIYNLVGDRVQKLFNAQAVIIASFDLENKTENFNYLLENGEKVKAESRPINKLRQILIDKKHSIYIATEEQARTEYGLTAIAGTKMSKSLLFVPLLSGYIIKGYVSLQNLDKENAFSNSDIRLLETLANSMSVAIENARLFGETTRLLKETEHRTAELAVINNVQEGLAHELDIQGIYDLVGKRIGELFDTQSVLIRSFDHSFSLEHWQYITEKGERIYSEPRPLIWANKLLIQTKKPLVINENYIETANKYGGTGVSKGLPPKSAIFVPMIVGEEVKGSVSLQNIEKENAFSETDLRLLTTMSNSMSVALENARLFDETNRLLGEAKQRAAELSTVNNISKALASQLDTDDLIKMVGDHLKDLFKANIVYLALLNQKRSIVDFPYQYGDNMPSLKLGEGLTSKIILSGEPLLLNKDLKEQRKQMGIQLIGVESASYLGAPIPVGGKNIGVLSVQSTEQENRFNENDLRLLSTIASSVGVALNNATLFEDVKVAKLEAEAASKAAEKANDAKSAFLSTVSHELRTPLTSVLGFAKIIKKRLEEKIFPIVDSTNPKIVKTINQVSENLHVVISEGERLTHLINDVLDLAKIEAGKMDWSQENVQLAEVAERAIAATTSLFDQKKLQLIRKIDPDLPEIIGDHDKLIQVVINLISNSVKFTDKGSITCRLQKKGDEVIVSIIDTGIGIKPEDFGTVFEQFKQVGGDTLTDKPKGTGLGLPICKEIVEHLGGRIWLESEIGKGSIFSFALPFIKSATVKEKPIHLDELVKQLKEQMLFSKLKVDGKNSTILIVDDDESIRSLLRQELTDAGYLTEEAVNGKDALECIRKSKPDLVILDVMMPEINGFDVAAILKNDPQTMDIPIIVLSVIQDKARGFRIGVDRYLNKPIDTVQLFAEVGALLEQGKSKKKVMVVDEDSFAIKTLTDVLKAKGYHVVESDGKELVEKAIANKPDIIILNSILTDKSEIVKSLRFEKGLENVLFFIYQ